MADRQPVPHSEQYRIAAKDWVDKDAAARMFAETKSAVLAKWIQDEGDKAHNKAERDVKASDKWMDFVVKMVNAKTAANLASVRLEYLKMKYWEHQGSEATARAEMKL